MAVTTKNTAGNTVSSVKLLLTQCCFLKQYTGPSMSVNFHTVKFLIPIIHYFHFCHWFSYSSSCSYLPLHTDQQHQPTRNPCTEKFSNQFSVHFVLLCFTFTILFMWRMIYLFTEKDDMCILKNLQKDCYSSFLGMFGQL